MTAKTYLQQIYRLKMKIEQRTQQLEELKASASGYKAIDYSADKVQVSPSDRMADVVGRFADLEETINHLISEYLYKKDFIIMQIQLLDDTRYVDLLYRRYVLFKPFRIIAKELTYDYKYCCRLHGKALQAFEKAYLNNKTNKHDT